MRASRSERRVRHWRSHSAAQWNRPARRAARRRAPRWAAPPRRTFCTARARATTSRRCVRRWRRATARRCTRPEMEAGSLSTRRRAQTRRKLQPICWCARRRLPHGAARMIAGARRRTHQCCCVARASPHAECARAGARRGRQRALQRALGGAAGGERVWEPHSRNASRRTTPALQGRWTPLHCSARDGHVEVTDVLLSAGADANAKSSVRGREADHHPDPPLTAARFAGGRHRAPLGSTGRARHHRAHAARARRFRQADELGAAARWAVLWQTMQRAGHWADATRRRNARRWASRRCTLRRSMATWLPLQGSCRRRASRRTCATGCAPGRARCCSGAQ